MYIIYCDGASRSNPGEASYGVSINLNNKEIDVFYRAALSRSIERLYTCKQERLD